MFGINLNTLDRTKKPKRKVYRYQKGDYESMRKDTLKFAKESTSMVTQILVRFKKTSI